MKYPDLEERFLRFVKINTRSDENSKTIPSTISQKKFLLDLKDELNDLGLSDVNFDENSGYVMATLPANQDEAAPVVGFLAHVDTADFNADDIRPQVIHNYDGKSIIKLGDSGFKLDPVDFPQLKKYKGNTLITTDGRTLLGSDDKSGVCEIISAINYLVAHPNIKHGKIRIGFGPDEEIGVGADKFDVKKFGADYAYTVDGGPEGQLEWETFNAAALIITIQGKNIHPSVGYHKMINALQVAIDFHNSLPKEFPENTKDREGFYHLTNLDGTVDSAQMNYIIRDFDKSGLAERKRIVQNIVDQLNNKYGADRVKAKIYDQYYNMREVINDHFEVVEIAEKAMNELDITPDETPVRGGTDGSKISFMGLPTPNIFAGGENMHGRFEFVSLETMEKATDVILEIIKLIAIKK